jgi:hypothetical protein
MKRIWQSSLAVAFVTFGCGRGVFLQNDGFSERLPGECSERWECTALLEEARRREATCEPNTVGRVRCDEARADLNAVERMKQRFDEREAEKERVAAERQLKQAELEEAERASAEEEALREEQAMLVLEQRRVEETAREARLGFYRPMTLDLRRQRLVRCHQDGTEVRQDLGVSRDCDTLLVDLLAVAQSDEEKQLLVRANEEAIEAVRKAKDAEQQREEASRNAPSRGTSSASYSSGSSSGGSGRLLCCDGSLSPSCTCGGSRRGCCSHHGGVCGCD